MIVVPVDEPAAAVEGVVVAFEAIGEVWEALDRLGGDGRNCGCSRADAEISP